MKAKSALNPSKSLGETHKVRWNQTKCSRDLRFCKERTVSRWISLCLIALESDVNLPDLAVREDGWEVESLIVPHGILLVWNHSASSGSRLLRLLLVPREDLYLLIGLYTELVDSGHTRERYCTPGAAVTMVGRCSSWENFHSCGLTASWYGDLTNLHQTTVL